MTGGDWVWVLIIVGFLIFTFCLDRIVKLDRERIERIERADSDRRLRREVERQP